MRKLLLLLGAMACASSALAQSESDPNEGSQLTHEPFNDTVTFSWWGRPGHTYFIQHSDDLLTWEYFQIIESGAGEALEWRFTSSADKFFVRLRFTDEPTSDPATADFDQDGVSNMAELEQGTDPFRFADDDLNGLPDDWETFYFGQTGADPNADPDGDGLKNREERALATDPNVNDLPGGSTGDIRLHTPLETRES